MHSKAIIFWSMFFKSELLLLYDVLEISWPPSNQTDSLVSIIFKTTPSYLLTFFSGCGGLFWYTNSLKYIGKLLKFSAQSFTEFIVHDAGNKQHSVLLFRCLTDIIDWSSSCVGIFGILSKTFLYNYLNGNVLVNIKNFWKSSL